MDDGSDVVSPDLFEQEHGRELTHNWYHVFPKPPPPPPSFEMTLVDAFRQGSGLENWEVLGLSGEHAFAAYEFTYTRYEKYLEFVAYFTAMFFLIPRLIMLTDSYVDNKFTSMRFWIPNSLGWGSVGFLLAQGWLHIMQQLKEQEAMVNEMFTGGAMVWELWPSVMFGLFGFILMVCYR